MARPIGGTQEREDDGATLLQQFQSIYFTFSNYSLTIVATCNLKWMFYDQWGNGESLFLPMGLK